MMDDDEKQAAYRLMVEMGLGPPPEPSDEEIDRRVAELKAKLAKAEGKS